MNKLFVGNLPLGITEMELAQLFGPYGDISTIQIVRDRQTNKPRGFAFVEMASGVKDAIEALDGASLGDQQLSVRFAETKPAESKPVYKKFQRPNTSASPERKMRPRRTS